MSNPTPETYEAGVIDSTPLNERPSYRTEACRECGRRTTHKQARQGAPWFCTEPHQGELPFDEPVPPPERPPWREVRPPLPVSHHDPVSRPEHYARNGVELADVVRAWGLGFYEGSAVKYVLRAAFKGNREQDLRKAIKSLEIALSEKS